MSLDIDNGNSDKKICMLCNKNTSKYTCPRCTIPYCSMECYKGEQHLNCSEKFYKNCVLTEMNQMKANKEDRSKIMEMLVNLENDDQSNLDDREEEEPDIKERFENINLDTASVEEMLEHLTVEEKEQFHLTLKTGAAINSLPILEPWWCKKNKANKGMLVMPMKMKNIQPFSELLSKDQTASPYIKYHVVNILLSYAYMYRVHNTTPEELPVNFVTDIIRLSFRDRASTLTSSSLAVHDMFACLQKECSDLSENNDFNLNVIEDVVKILSLNRCESASLNAISDIRNTFKLAKIHEDYSELSESERKSMRIIKKKLEFYISWIKDYADVLFKLIPELLNEYENIKSEMKKHNDITQYINKNMHKLKSGKPKIVEM